MVVFKKGVDATGLNSRPGILGQLRTIATLTFTSDSSSVRIHPPI